LRIPHVATDRQNQKTEAKSEPIPVHKIKGVDGSRLREFPKNYFPFPPKDKRANSVLDTGVGRARSIFRLLYPSVFV
jgi:hypothetical protein